MANRIIAYMILILIGIAVFLAVGIGVRTAMRTDWGYYGYTKGETVNHE